MPTESSRFVPPPLYRHLRGYAIDPSLAQRLETAPVSRIEFKIPWEPLEPGPVGEYLEVIDLDSAAGCLYEPVNLDDPFVLAQDGLPPSEGTPQFHQQMVYAVAQLTIQNFERALGRRTLWSPGPSPDPNEPLDDSHFVPRLRIHPHALRESNAYYSPAKKALLFGYFPAPEEPGIAHIPGNMVFTCLSHDIVAHETTHALLDGLHRGLSRPTNPDMLAFHEAFADIVALFQHFTFRDILRHQIARTRGDIASQETVLGQLAGQFGRATGARSALRDAIGHFDENTGRWVPRRADPTEYARTFEPHLRGSILVAAIFDAFLTIYNGRIADLLRLSTGGSGILPSGAIHPDLVERLAQEAAKSANHVLDMCVRALDYCPPVDLTFGEYLRALITADADLVPDDDRNYRVAFADAFRRRGIFPRDVRSLSAENLVWRSRDRDTHQPSPGLVEILGGLREFAHQQLYAADREQMFRLARAARAKLQRQLRNYFENQKERTHDGAFLGLNVPGQSFQVHAMHFAARVSPDGDLLLQAIVQLKQAARLMENASDALPGENLFEGGCTLIIDLEGAAPDIKYCIRKPVDSVTRRERQRRFVERFANASLRATYFGEMDATELQEPFALLHRGSL